MSCFLKTAHEPSDEDNNCSWLVRSISHGILGWVSYCIGAGHLLAVSLGDLSVGSYWQVLLGLGFGIGIALYGSDK